MPKPVTITSLSDNAHGTREGERFGIEIEVEGLDVRLFPGRFDFWRHTDDASLRGTSMEFQSTPLPREAIRQALSEIYRPRSFWRPSIRTGIHVHVNMLGRNLEDVRNLFLYYLYMEPLFYRLCGEEREQNIYCVPMYRQPEEVQRVWGALKSKADFRNQAGRLCKYVGLYLEPLKRFGTLEFRMAPTWRDMQTTEKWIETIDRLLALDSITAKAHPHKMYSEVGIEGMVAAIWPDWQNRFNLTLDELAVIYNRTQADEVALATMEPGPIEAPWGRPGTYEPQGEPMPEPDAEEKLRYVHCAEVRDWMEADTPTKKKAMRDGGVVGRNAPMYMLDAAGRAVRVPRRIEPAPAINWDEPPPPPPPVEDEPVPQDDDDFDDYDHDEEVE